MKMQFVGIKHIVGDSSKNGKHFDFHVACLVSPMEQRDIEKGAHGMDVHTPTIPDRYKDILCEANIGKDIEAEFYYSNGRENIGYCALIK